MINVLTLENGQYRVHIYAKDHNPPHIHVFGPGDAEVQLELRDFTVIHNQGFKKKAVKRIVKELELYKDDLMETWELYHGK